MTDQPNGTNAFVSSIPPWHRFLRPLLEAIADGNVWQKKDMERAALDHAGLSNEQREEILPSGQSRALNRIGWATSDLVRAKAIDRPARAIFQITETGRQLLAEGPGIITPQRIQRIPAYQEYVPLRGRDDREDRTIAIEGDGEDPLEQIESGVAQFEADVASDLIRRLRDQNPDFFEQAVVDLLIAMGYGGAEQRVRRLGHTGDGEWTASSTRTLSGSTVCTCRRSATVRATRCSDRMFRGSSVRSPGRARRRASSSRRVRSARGQPHMSIKSPLASS